MNIDHNAESLEVFMPQTHSYEHKHIPTNSNVDFLRNLRSLAPVHVACSKSQLLVDAGATKPTSDQQDTHPRKSKPWNFSQPRPREIRFCATLGHTLSDRDVDGHEAVEVAGSSADTQSPANADGQSESADQESPETSEGDKSSESCDKETAGNDGDEAEEASAGHVMKLESESRRLKVDFFGLTCSDVVTPGIESCVPTGT